MDTPETTETTRPWAELDRLVEAGDTEQLERYLDELPAGEATRAFSRLGTEGQERLLIALPPPDAAHLVEHVDDALVSELMHDLPRETAAAILEELPSDEQADLITSLDHEDAEGILAEMEPEAARQARQLARFPAGVAGGLMATEVIAYRGDQTVDAVIADLRGRADELEDRQVQYAYVTDGEGVLFGVLRLRDLLMAPGARHVGTLARRDPLTVRASATLDDLDALFDDHAFLGLPVVGKRGNLMGVVHRVDVEEAVGDRTESDYLKSQGIVGGEELRTMSIWSRSRRRLSWLSINIVLNVVAASVIAFYQDTLSAVIALAVFLPIISDMSGCSGNQAVAVSMRELSLGLVRPNELLWVWGKEVLVGLINGVLLGLLVATVAWVWKGSPHLGLVVGGALAVNTVLAVSVGGTVPLLLRRAGLDPALASGPILTTITDLCGFLLVLALATSMLPLLVGV